MACIHLSKILLLSAFIKSFVYKFYGQYQGKGRCQCQKEADGGCKFFYVYYFG